MRNFVPWLALIPGLVCGAEAPAPNTGLPGSVAAAGYRFTPAVKEAYLVHAKAAALESLKAAGRELPADFLAWVESDPVVRDTVYGSRKDAAGVLVMLRSLELDLGAQAVRKDFTQLALAMAVVHAAKAPEADLKPHDPLKVLIPGDPRQPVNTKDPARKLDLNDHIINFLNDHTITEDVVVGHKEEPPPLKYDDKGIAIPPPKNAKKIKVPITEKRTRTLYGADVIASRALQEEFNAYMKAKGHDVNIDCGDKVVFWKSTAAVRPERKKINEAFVLFRTAYEAKGLLPAARDPLPTPGESAAYYIRNNSHVFPEEVRAQRNWPRYPLNAPWPTLTLLAADNQPLREREERWLAFRDKGEMRTYGEYIGPIAQQFDMQSARRVSPHPFSYGTYQMMAKDGGVCGTMANMGVRTYNTLGIPSCTAGQPGHCALILFAFDPKTQTYECKGGQFATGGPDKTSPHTPWVFGDTDARKGMLYYQTIGWAVNFGLREYLDSTIAWQVFKTLPPDRQAANGLSFLLSAIPVNPYNILLTDAALATAAVPRDVVRVCKTVEPLVAAVNRPGCPKDGYYLTNLRAQAYSRIASLPVPADPSVAKEILAWLPNDAVEPVVHYSIAIDGLDAVTSRTKTTLLPKHLAAGLARTDAACAGLTTTLNAVAARIPDKKARKQWAAACWQTTAGHEAYLGRKDKITVDPAVAALAKLAGAKLPAEEAIQQPVLVAVAQEGKTRLASPRNAKDAARFAAKVTAIAAQITDPARRRAWLESLAATLKGHETFPAGKKTQRDPAADAILKLLATPAAS